MRSRDRGKAKNSPASGGSQKSPHAGRKERRKAISDSELALQLSEVCQLVRQQNRELIAQLQQQRIILLERLPSGKIQ